MTSYRPAPPVEAIARKLCAQYHQHLHSTRIEYVFRDKAAKHNGKTVLGSARKVSGLQAMLATPGAVASDDMDFFVIEIAEDIWDQLPQHKREALVDHELCHCLVAIGNNGNVKLSLMSHDVEEFSEVIARHGLWKDDIKEFIEGIGKPQLEAIAQQLPGI